MKFALLFREGEEKVLVSAEDIKNGKYSRTEEFVDPEYEFRVQYVCRSRHNGSPYFRLYYSYEEYKRLYPDRATRYEIVANMRRYQESQWHKRWKENVEHFCEIEKTIKNESTQKYKFADAFYSDKNTCIEFQHSYIALDFEERNKFYSDLGISVLWLYDLSRANACEDDDLNIEILEDNARGFFRISEDPNNLKNNLVYIQVKSGLIYRVKELGRRESSTTHKSTIRYFEPSEIYTESEFIEHIQNIQLSSDLQIAKKEEENPAKRLDELWQPNFKWMIVKNIENGDEIMINRGPTDEMIRDFVSGCIKYKYVDGKYDISGISRKKRRDYILGKSKEYRPIWILLGYKFV